MGFATGAKVTADIIDDIVNSLIITGVWHNVDTTWNTLVRTENDAKVILAYGTAGGAGKGNTTLSANLVLGTKTVSVVDETNFSSGDKIVIGSGITSEVRIVSTVSPGTLILDANVNTTHITGERIAELDHEIYMAIEIINQTSGVPYDREGPYYAYTYYYAKGIRIVFSASWDAVAHTYPASNQSTFIPFESCHNCGVSADFRTLMVPYYLWMESNGSGFVLMAKPEPTGDSRQQSFILVLERSMAKEYTDGYTNFFLYTVGNIWAENYDGGYAASIWRNRSILRPFAFQWPDGGGKTTAFPNGYGISFVPMPSYYAFRSNGNNKVYYVKPIINNITGQTAPVLQSDLFFLWSEEVGLIDGDVVSIEGRTTKYLCNGLGSPDSTGRITYAMKYVA